MNKIISAIGISHNEFFADTLEAECNDEGNFHIDMIISSLTSLLEDKLKYIAEAIVKITEAIE